LLNSAELSLEEEAEPAPEFWVDSEPKRRLKRDELSLAAREELEPSERLLRLLLDSEPKSLWKRLELSERC